MATPPNTIVFGPTGAVGSAVATTAHDLGAHVTLAMRDPSKTIPGISNNGASNTTRLRADLTDPASVRSAVRESGAKHAFFYLAHGTPEFMKATIQALKDGGIAFVVFLSSFTVSEPLDCNEPSDLLAFLHAQVEKNLCSIFGADNYVALRPGSFASNEAQLYAPFFKEGEEVKVTYPFSRVDCIVPADIGRVGGTILAKGLPADGKRAIYLYGPQFLTGRGSVATIANVLGKEPKVVECDVEEARKVLGARGFPPPLVEYFLRTTHKGDGKSDGEDEVFGHKIDLADMGNVEKYGGGGKATTFEEYVRSNKEMFGGKV